MLNLPLNALVGLDGNITQPVYKVKVCWQEPETYTEDDLLFPVGDLCTSISESGYEIANVVIALRNEDYYFSRRLAKELPNNKLVEIFMLMDGEDILVFRGVVPKEGGWTLTETKLELNIKA